MKKTVSLFIVLFLLLSCLGGCACKHEWIEADCEHPRTCALCGETEGEPLGHDMLPADCEFPERCARCGLNVGEPLGHSFVGGNLIEEPECERCGLKAEEALKKDTYLETFTNATKTTLPDAAVKAMTDYLDAMYDSFVHLKERDLTCFFEDGAYEEAYISQTAEKLMLESRKYQLLDLKMTDFAYDLKVTSISKSGSTITIAARESWRGNFSFMRELTTEIRNVKISFTLAEQKDGSYKIKKADRTQDFMLMIRDKYKSKSTKAEITAALDAVLNDYIKIYENRFEQMIELLEEVNETPRTPKTCDHPFDREKAAAASRQYMEVRTKPDYSDAGGNCQNFASWILIAGGIPMDTEGSAVWKHYGSYNSESNEKKGWSASYIQVGAFRTYAKNNTGYGLVSEVGANRYYGEAGDILQVGYGTGYRHTTSVIQQYKINDTVVDILLNSNTIDMVNFPLSAYTYYNLILIKIDGWNDI